MLFFLGMLKYTWSCRFELSCLTSVLGESRFAVPWSYGRLGGLHSFINHAQYFGYLLPSITIVMAHLVKRVDWRVAISAAFSLVFMLFVIQDGGRRIVGMVLGSALLVWALLLPKIEFRHVLRLGVAAILLLVLMQLMVIYRSPGLQAIWEGGEIQLEYDSSFIKVDANFKDMVSLVEIFPNEKEFLGAKPLLYVLVRPIPRAIWSGKPTDRGFDLGKYQGKRATLTTSAVGDWYIMWGWFSVFFGGVLTGGLAQMANAFLNGRRIPARRLMFALSAMTLFVGLRALHEVVILGYSVLAVALLLWLRRQYYGGPSKTGRRAAL